MKTGSIFAPAAAPSPGIVDIGDRKQLFLDDLLIDQASRISKFPCRPQKSPNNPVIEPDRSWEQGRYGGIHRGVEITGQTVLYDEEENIFKMWYNSWVWEDGRRPWCYAVSHDGFAWEKPDLGIYEYEGSTRNNILADWGDPHYFNVFKDPHDPDPQRRYKAHGELEGPIANVTGGVASACSPDGLHWIQHPGNPLVRHGTHFADASTLLGWDPRRQKYVAYFRPGHPLAHEIDGIGVHRHIRTIGYAESDDFELWTPTRIMLAPDDQDRVDYQYMQFTTGIYDEFYVGFLMMHKTHEQVWDTYLLSSRDGFHWTWVDRHEPFLGRGEIGRYDAGYMTPSGPILHDGTIWVYYGAFSGAHSANPTRLGSDVMTIALATLPQDRWVGLLAGPSQGLIVTRPLVFKGSKLRVDIDASVPQSRPGSAMNFDECEVRAALTDPSGGVLAGFTADRSTRLLASGVHQVSWDGADLSRLAGEPVRLRLEMRNACLYSIQFVQEEKT